MIYVDDLNDYPAGGLRSTRWCHMATDGDLAGLHRMAARLGLKRSWFQNEPRHPHYDLTPSKRASALRLGARAVSTDERIRRCFPPASPSERSERP